MIEFRRHRSLGCQIRRSTIWYFRLCAAIAVILPTISGPGVSFTLAADSINYTARIEGVTDKKLLKLLQSVSECMTKTDRPPASLGLLRKRVDRDVELFQKALRSRGFYAVKVSSTVQEDKDPVEVVFGVESGPPYVIKSVDIQIVDAEEEEIPSPPDPESLGLSPGVPAESRVILDGQQSLIRYFKERGFPFPDVAQRKVVVDHATQEASVSFRVNPGPVADFGATEIVGLQAVEEDYLRSRLPWKEGDPFRVDLLSEARSRLRQTDLLATVQIKPAENLDEKGQLPVTITVKERKHRTIKGGASYATDEGLGGKVSWEHRNLFGRGERLYLGFTISQIAYAAESEFRKSGFLHRDLSFIWDFRLADDHPEAYDSRNITTALRIERMIEEGMTLSAGLGFRASDVEQVGEEERFRLLFLPLLFDWDASDDLLDPTRGGRLGLQLTPFYDILESDLGFLKGFARYSHYFTLSEAPSIVLAGRGTLGSITGADLSGIPADLRYYAGGAGSIRGYAYKTVGPLLGDEPVGGRSLIELSAELRVKLTKKFGLVGFIDGGNAYDSELPDFGEELRWGAGLGVRYYTPIGPLRLDGAIPLNRREGIDDDFQIYVSIGQAF